MASTSSGPLDTYDSPLWRFRQVTLTLETAIDPKKTRSVLRQQWRDVNDLQWTAEEEEGELSGVVLAEEEVETELTRWRKDEWRYVSGGCGPVSVEIPPGRC
jgi:predicted transcriptional regulator